MNGGLTLQPAQKYNKRQVKNESESIKETKTGEGVQDLLKDTQMGELTGNRH